MVSAFAVSWSQSSRRLEQVSGDTAKYGEVELLWLTMQEYCRQEYHKEVVPVTSCQDLQPFYDCYVIHVGKNATGVAIIGRSWKHIAMVYFHGYVTHEEWRGGGFPDPHSHFTFRQDTMRAADANGHVCSTAYAVVTVSAAANLR